MSFKIETVFEVKHDNKNSELLIAASGQEAAKSIDKKFKGKFIKKILKGFNIDGNFFPFIPPKIYNR